MPSSILSPLFQTDEVKERLDAEIQRLTHQQVEDANEASETNDLNNLMICRDCILGEITYSDLLLRHSIMNDVMADLFFRNEIIDETLYLKIKPTAAALPTRHM